MCKLVDRYFEFTKNDYKFFKLELLYFVNEINKLKKV